MDDARRRFGTELPESMRVTAALGAVVLTTLILGCSSGPSSVPAPDPGNWKPVNVEGPALFIAKATSSEGFESPPNVSYGCHTVDNKDSSSPGRICISNSCGLDRFILVPETTYRGTVPRQIVLYAEMGEWCDSTYVNGQRFLISVSPDGNWSASEVMEAGSDPLILPDSSGCLGDIDLKPLLRTAGRSIGPFHSKDYLEWRRLWAVSGIDGCDGWLVKDEDIEYKALPLSIVVALWEQRHQ